MTQDDAPGDAERGVADEAFVNLLTEHRLREQCFPTKYVAFIDMLGFSALTKEFPGSLTLEVGPGHSSLSTSTSKSSERFGRFHAALDRIASDVVDASRPERMMIFSDCAFAVYDNPLQAAVSLTQAMRTFLRNVIPVRMCLAKGTCHYERFSIESFPTFNLTRSMFYGSGVVYAVEGEKKSGKGCRIFLSTSLDAADIAVLQNSRYVLDLERSNDHCQCELNYLHETNGMDAGGGELDEDLWVELVKLRREVKPASDPTVIEQYDSSFRALQNMRRQHGRTPFPPFDLS
jgi:hypothetical protein